MHEIRLLRAALIVLLLSGSAWGATCLYPFDGTYPLTTLRAPNGGDIEIRGDIVAEVSQGIVCRFAGRSALIGFTTEPPGGLSLQVVHAEQGKLIALVEARAPDVVLWLRDLGADEGFPDRPRDESRSEQLDAGKRLLARLQAAHPEVAFSLSFEVPGDRRLRLGM